MANPWRKRLFLSALEDWATAAAPPPLALQHLANQGQFTALYRAFYENKHSPICRGSSEQAPLTFERTIPQMKRQT
jgi:hypothetical protein